MAKKNLAELEADLLRLKERENKIKEELALQRKAADAKAMKARNRKIFLFSEMIISHLGENILEHSEDFEFFLMKHLQEIKEMLHREEQ